MKDEWFQAAVPYTISLIPKTMHCVQVQDKGANLMHCGEEKWQHFALLSFWRLAMWSGCRIIRHNPLYAAWVAQWLEALTGNHRIESSNPTGAKEFVLCS